MDSGAQCLCFEHSIASFGLEGPERAVRLVKLMFTLVKIGNEGRKCTSGMYERHIQSFIKKSSLSIVLEPNT